MPAFLARIVASLIARVNGPLGFRFVLQPAMAAVAAIKAGIRDGKTNLPAYVRGVLSGVPDRRRLLRDGRKDVGRIVVLAVVVDLVYQLMVGRWARPGESLLVAVVLVVIPYLALRGPVGRIVHARRVRRRKQE
jgi:hypothetical protein